MISQKSATIISVAVAVFCVIVVVFVLRFPVEKPTPSVTPSNIPEPTQTHPPLIPAPIPSNDNQVRDPVSFQSIPFPAVSPVVVIQDPGVVWLSKAIKLPYEPALFVGQDYSVEGSVDLYKIGTQDGKDLVAVLIHEMGTSSYLLRKEGSRYALITN